MTSSPVTGGQTAAAVTAHARTTHTRTTHTTVEVTGKAWTTGPVDDWAGPVPTCGWAITSAYPTAPTATPAPNACVFGGMSAECRLPTMIVSDAATRTLATWTTPSGGTGSRIYSGARGYICIGQDGNGAIWMSDGEQGILVEPNDHPIVYASRIDLARSSGVWGIVPLTVTGVQIVDAARPDGTRAELDLLPGGDHRVFLAPASSSDVTIIALDTSSHELARTVVPRVR